jgi:hypothetical protein
MKKGPSKRISVAKKVVPQSWALPYPAQCKAILLKQIKWLCTIFVMGIADIHYTQKE